MYRKIKSRRRSGRTNYKRRIALLNGNMPRIVIRKTNRRIITQIISYGKDGDRVVAHAESGELRKLGWEPRANAPTAYLTGMLLAKKAKGSVKGDVVLDIGLHKPVKSSVIFAGAKGAADGGLGLLNNIEIDGNRVRGGHVAEYAKSGKATFSAYQNANFNVSNIAEIFDGLKKKIME